MKTPISRRTMLKGLGTATITLPLLEEMLVSRGIHVRFVVGIRDLSDSFRRPHAAGPLAVRGTGDGLVRSR